VEPSYAGIRTRNERVSGSSKKHLGWSIVCSFSHFPFLYRLDLTEEGGAAGSSVTLLSPSSRDALGCTIYDAGH
jgi:hypothetical protein